MQYEVKVLRGNEGLMAILLEAADALDAAAQAKAQGYTVIATRVKQRWSELLPWQRHRFPLLMFSQELVALLEAGLSLVEALEALTEKEAQPQIRKTLTQIITALYEGRSFSQALEQSPQDFPALYVATVRASEKTGALAEVLSRYIVYQTQMEGIRGKVVSSSIYPAILAGVGGLVLLFLMMFVVPRFSLIYADIGGDLPLMSWLLMQWGQLLDRHWLAFLLGISLLAGGLVFAAMQPACRRWAEQRLWRIPALGRQMQLYQMARFYRSLGMLLQGGMPVLQALRLVGGLLQASMRGQLVLAATAIKEGASISHAMEQHGLATPLALRLLRVGERTGRMGEMMERIAIFHDEEMARWVDWFTRLFEPLLMVFIGLTIGLIVVLLYMPIFELAGSIQ